MCLRVSLPRTLDEGAGTTNRNIELMCAYKAEVNSWMQAIGEMRTRLQPRFSGGGDDRQGGLLHAQQPKPMQAAVVTTARHVPDAEMHTQKLNQTLMSSERSQGRSGSSQDGGGSSSGRPPSSVREAQTNDSIESRISSNVVTQSNRTSGSQSNRESGQSSREPGQQAGRAGNELYEPTESRRPSYREMRRCSAVSQVCAVCAR
jgi:hypothetical protein